ncbi:MAG: DUF4331 domain-containing protein [Caldilineaceae bacterium]
MQTKRSWRTRIGVAAGVVVAVTLLAGGVLVGFARQAAASSHREAPLISKDPYADNTDTYAFLSPADQNRLVLLASWIPFEGPEGGPNYYEWDDSALYDIYVDNNGDATADYTYTLASQVQVGNPNTFLYNTGPIGSVGDADWNRKQFYTVTETAADGTMTVLVANQPAAPANIGEKSTKDYAALEAETFYNAPGGIKVFAGQTDDPFFVDLQVFDLLTLRSQQPPIGYHLNNIPVDSLSGFNVHSMAIEVPVSRLKQGSEPVLGVWSGTRRETLPVLETVPAAGAAAGATLAAATYKPVSRLGMPLVNEVVIPMGLKDVFNTLSPNQDLGAYSLLQKSVENPEIGTLLCALYNVPLPGDANKDCSTEFTPGTPRTGRGDIFDVFLTGMKLTKPFTIATKNGPVTLPAGANVNQPANVVPAEMIRINTDIKGDLCSPTPSRLGVLGGDACGFPNGRRLTDDVVEIELLAVAGAAYGVLDGRDASFSFNPALIGVLTDGVDHNDVSFRDAFPYVARAQSGQGHWHTNPFYNVLLPWIFNQVEVKTPG